MSKKTYYNFLPVCGVYAIINLTTGRAYIGQSHNIASRWQGHKAELNQGKHHNKALQDDWVKYGELGFSIHIIIRCDPEYLLSEEEYCIKEYKNLAGTYNT